MRRNEVFNLPEGGTIVTNDYVAASNPSSGASVLTTQHKGRKLTKMVSTMKN